MTVLPQATSRRELRERDADILAMLASLPGPVGPPVPVPVSSAVPVAAPPAEVPPSAPPLSALSPGRTSRPTVPRSVPRTRGSRRTTTRHRVASKLLSVAAMAIAAALAVGMSFPANALSAAAGTAPSGSSVVNASGTAATAVTAPGFDPADAQSATVAADPTLDVATRDGFGAQSWAELLAEKYAALTNYAYKGSKGSVRWPFIGQATISSPYGPRAPLCATCTSSFHSGTDFLPGVGAPIFAIANGVVTDHTENVTDLGNNVTITHKIGKDVVTSIYGHMQAGSSPLVVGQAVKVGDFVGLVGDTGESTGPHLHLGITVNGVQTDPVPWMMAHVK